MPRKLAPTHLWKVPMEGFLKPMGISLSELARDIRVPASRISQTVRGKRCVHEQFGRR